MQLFGGIRVTDEHDIGLFFKRMQALSTICGDVEGEKRYEALVAYYESVGLERERKWVTGRLQR